MARDAGCSPSWPWPRRGRSPGQAIPRLPRTRWPRHPSRSGSRITCRDSTIRCLKCFRSVTRESTGPCRCRCRAMSAARSCCRAFAVRVCAGRSRACPPRYRRHAETPGVLCYANRVDAGYVFDIAPRQPGFGFVAEGEPDLLWSGPRDFDWLPVRIAWLRMSSVLPLGYTSPIRETADIGRIVAFQNPRDFVAFITMPRSSWLGSRGCALRRPGAATNCGGWISTESHGGAPAVTRDRWVDVPSPSARLLVVRRGDAAR